MTTTVTVKEDKLRVYIFAAKEVIAQLREDFRFRPNGYNFSAKYELFRLSGGEEGWDGYVYPLVRTGFEQAMMPRGYRDDVLAACRHRGYEVNENLLPRPFAAAQLADIVPDVIKTPYQLDVYQRQGVLAWLRESIGICQVTVSGGKCLGLGTPVVMEDGRLKKVEDVKVGDRLLGPDSRVRRVLALGRGRAPMYRVVQANGDAYTCNGDHILALQRRIPTGNFQQGNRQYNLHYLTPTVDEFMALPAWKRKEHFGYKVGVELPERAVPMEPYLLGLWLGDGSRHKPMITTGDAEVKRYVEEAAARMGLKVHAEPGQGCEELYMTTGRKTPHNAFNRKLKSLGFSKPAAKLIPDVYKRNSRAVRLSLLAGLVDSDGHAKRPGQVEIVSVFETLAADIVWLARSLGFSASVRPKRTTCQTGAVGMAHRVRITGDLDQLPTLIPRKKGGSCLRGGLRTRISITPLGEGDYYGFELDGDGLFLLGDFTVTHNTAMFCAATRIIKDRFPKTRFIYMTPSERLVKQVTASAREYLPDFEIGQYGGGKAEMNAADMVVCTVAMLNRNIEHLIRAGWFKTFNCILFDEVHHCGSASAERVLAQIPAFWRFGASDTTKEDDPSRRSKMVGQFGSTLIEVKATPHIESGRMATPHIYVEDMGDYRNRFDGLDFTAALGTPAWCLIEQEWKQAIYRGPVQKLDSDGNPVMKKKFTVEMVDDKIVKKTEEVAVTEIGLHLIEVDSENIVMESRWVLLSRVYDLGIILFKERNARIVKWASYYSSKGYPTLVVATRTLHIYILETLLKEAARPELVRILFGWATPNERDEAFDWFRATPGSILITPLVKEGVSINEIRAGVIADCVGDSETANQIIGRFLRKKPDEGENFAEITWFRDSQHPTLRRSSNHVLTAFAGYGYNVYDGPSAPDIDRLLKGVQSPASGAKAKPKRRRRA